MQYSTSEAVPPKSILSAPQLPQVENPRLLADALVAWQALPTRQRPHQLASYLLAALPVDLVAVFMTTPRGLRRASGSIRPVGTRADQQNTPEQLDTALWRALRRMAVDAQTQHMPGTATDAHSWGTLIAMPLIAPPDQDRGVIVLGCYSAESLATVGDMLAQAAPMIAAAMPPTPARVGSLDLDTVIDAIDEGMLMVDSDYAILRLNPAFTHITGWDDRVVGQTCRDVIRCHDEQDRPFCDTIRCPLASAQTATLKQPLARTLTHIDFHGHRTNQVSLGATPLKQEHGTPGYAVLVRDASPLAEALRERDTFLSDISHELRNRMNPILGFIDMVASGQAGRIATRQREHLSYAHTSAIELMEYIQNRLYLSRNETNSVLLNPDLVDAAALLAEVEQHLTLEADSAQIRLVRVVEPTMPQLRGDHFRLRQMLLNLTMNAIKFTPAGGEVRLRAQRDGVKLLFSVADTGTGIAPADQAHIFEQDFKAERNAPSGKTKGGLGLAAAQAIVLQHGGAIWFTSAVNVGTTFYVQLPL